MGMLPGWLANGTRITWLLIGVALAVHAAFSGWWESHAMERRLEQYRHQEMVQRKAQLKDLVNIMVEAVSGMDEGETRRRLRDIRYGNEGYFFVYDFAGVNQVQDPLPELEGQSLIDLKDATGKPVIKELIAAARFGDGYYRYRWPRPSHSPGHFAKLSYVQVLPGRNWIVGTGFYLNDLEVELAGLRQQMDQERRQRRYGQLWLLLLWLALYLCWCRQRESTGSGVARPRWRGGE